MLLKKVIQSSLFIALTTSNFALFSLAENTSEMPGYYHTKLGKLNVTALFDGATQLDPNLFKGVDDQEKQRLLTNMFMNIQEPIQTAVNAFLVESDQNLTLIDTGAAKCFGDGLGDIPKNLQKSGYNLEDVTQIVLTHLHPDHACGLVNDEQKVFPNAKVYVTEKEANYWLNPEISQNAPEEMQGLFTMSVDSVAPYQKDNQLIILKEGEQINPTINIVDTSGHTPGHISVMINDGDSSVLVWGDIVHNYAMQLNNPNISVEFDSDQSSAITARKNILKDASSKKYWIAGAHMPFPGIGRIQQDNEEQYRWVPIEFSQEMK